ncbi:helix-turn-helix domain-containing protein [Bradyrhizobium sp. Pear77]|uniref:helix-turn-helix transcriptional regulator n=1 Tax=Bradyrhizobium altum TaxID=1571202 RepID=UPI001E5565EF|nr:helix-turn-helix domain-containing protein [Bradyrhizobium altum]MCC8956188.1 helix-turn-helix domain-containing protein [Bradyrhizobium altum]
MKTLNDSEANYLNVSQAAEYLGLSTSFLNKRRRAHGAGPSFIKVGKRVLYDCADLELWMHSLRAASTTEAAGVIS